MKIVRCKKKGMTLIEAIISVALLSVLTIPISGLVMTSINTSKRSEIKQEATYIGQKLLEEMKIYDKITLGDFNDFQLLNGQIINKSEGSEEFTGEFTIDKYDIEMSLTKDGQFIYEDNASSNIVDTNQMDAVIYFVNDGSGKIKYNDVKYGITNNLTIKSPNNESDELIVLDTNGDTIFTIAKSNERNNKILFTINEGFNENINIDFHNERAEEVNIFVKKDSNNTGNININAFKGKVKIYNNIRTGNKNNVGDLYKIEVIVKNKENTLFTGEVLQNILIERRGVIGE